VNWMSKYLLEIRDEKQRYLWIAPYGTAAVMVGFMSPVLVPKLNDRCDKKIIKWFGCRSIY
jgi:hypothetical protein